MAMSDVREGFLCPICMKDLGTVSLLQDHFEEEHSNEDKDVLQQLRGLFGRAKKKILGEKEESNFSTSANTSITSSTYTRPAPSVAGYDPAMWDPQEVGQIRSRTDQFKAIRGAKVDRYVVETNKLIIRLDKLTSPDVPSDSSKRKAFEKSLVPWTPDNMVQACPYCKRSFTLTRRRHHCRLCGDIMCDKCSQFLPHTFAKKLTDPAFQFDMEVGFLKRSGSNTSLNSILGPEGDPHIRTCSNCRKLLERRHEQMEQRNNKPDIALLYERMKMCIDSTEELLKDYLPMVESLSVGESTYDLKKAQQLRAKISKLYETIDGLSKKILVLGLNSEQEPQQKHLLLQKAIRAYASNFMQDNIIGLQSLPTEEQYLKVQEVRKLEIQQRIAAERQAAIEAQERERRAREAKEGRESQVKSHSSGSHHTDQRERSASQKLAGWIPTEGNINYSNKDDPMIQQMDIIRGYIKQARQAQKFDEVQMLEQNLKELQQEYLRQQRNNWS